MIIKLHYFLMGCLTVALSGCYPKGAEYAEDVDLVYTNYSADFDFSGRTTYALPDSVIKITGDIFNDPDGDGKPQFITAPYAGAILNQIRDNMTALGWTMVDKESNPNVILLVSAMTTTNVYYYYDWSYWDWWYPGWAPYWGWYYPGYYYPPYVTGYRSGSVFIQMTDHQTALTADNVPVVWNCILNGLAEGSTADLTARIQGTINKAFQQSPYLKH